MLSHPSSHPLLTIGGTKFYTFIPLSPTISRHPHHPNRDVCVCTLTKFPSPLTWVPSLANLSYVVRKPSYIWSTIVVSLFVFWFASFFLFLSFCFLIFFPPYDFFFPLLSSCFLPLLQTDSIIFFFSPLFFFHAHDTALRTNLI